MNPFESGARKAIPATLIYARRGGRILMIHRNAPDRPGDYHAGKWNGLGGKLEADESPLEAAIREFGEEAGIFVPEDAFRPLGVLQFPDFKAHKHEDWIVWVFGVDLDAYPELEPLSRSSEGELHWVPVEDLMSLNLWPGDREFIPYIVEGRPFVGTIWYRGPDVVRAWVHGI